jgi:ketosteroid isomerase-like protein
MDTARELTLIEEQLAASWVAGDHTYHERVLAEDWRVIDPTGNILTKADVLGEAFSGERKITKGKIDQVNVRDFGDWAVVTGRTQMAGTYQGQKMDVTLRFTDIFVRRDGEWKCIASQGTYVTE